MSRKPMTKNYENYAVIVIFNNKCSFTNEEFVQAVRTIHSIQYSQHYHQMQKTGISQA